MTLKSDLSMNGNENSEIASSVHYETGSNLNIKYYEKELEKCREQNSILVRKYNHSLEEIEVNFTRHLINKLVGNLLQLNY